MASSTAAPTTPGTVQLSLAEAARQDFTAAFGPERLHLRRSERAARARDASHYLLVPRLAATATDADAVAHAFHLARTYRLPVTLRSGGTSLSGQASGGGLLLDTRQHFRDIEVLDGGARVRCGPGATVRAVNARLAPYGTKLGPDPASEIAATIGGVVANNSSGMACGTQFNTYATLDSLTVVLPSGTVIDTGAPDADEVLAAREPALHAGLTRLREEVLASPDACARIAAQYAMKNTMGYGLNSLIDFATPVDMLAHLLVGSEGTLGFVSSVTLRTRPVLSQAATALLLFEELAATTDALPTLLAAGARTLELMDTASIRTMLPELAPTDPLRGVRLDRHTALLVELEATSADELGAVIGGAGEVLGALPLALPAFFTQDAAERARLWTLRKGLYTAVAGAREPGTTALLEDVVVPLEQLTAATRDLGDLLRGRGYDDAVIFGHAKDGNLHFMITPHLDSPAELATYEAFTDDLVDLILGRGGSLKAEHGTGRIMAPYVRRQFGDELYGVMRAIKRLFDPAGIMNPGVLLSDDPQVHVQHLKVAPLVDPAVDRCVDCGYCEPSCPAKHVTTTPRQRIALMRTMATAGPRERRELARDFDYAAVDTCAADSLCVVACPVHIDTGKVMKGFRAERHSPVVQRAGDLVARGWGPVGGLLRGALTVARFVPSPLLTGVTRAARRVLPPDWIPEAGADLPGPGRPRSGLALAPAAVQEPSVTAQGARAAAPVAAASTSAPASPVHPASHGDSVVLFASCIGGLFAPAKGGPGAGPALLELCARAGVEVTVPDGIDGLCCGTVWSSKGLTTGHRTMAERTVEALLVASDGGRLPIVCDASSCTHGLDQLREVVAEGAGGLTILDSVTFVRREILPVLDVRPVGSVAVHPTCSTVHLGAVDDLTAIAQECAERVFVPSAWGCCAFAGDRGMLHPELTASATAPEAAAIWAEESATGGHFDAYVSANRTCELGVSRATDRTYQHVLELLVSRLG